MTTLDIDIYSLSSKRQWTLFASNGFQEKRTEHHTSDIAAYLPFYWICFICVYRLCIIKSSKDTFKQYLEEDCKTIGKYCETRTIKVIGLFSKWMAFFGEKWPCSLLQI